MKDLIDVDELDETQRKLYYTSLFLGKLLLVGLVFRAILFIYPSTYGLQEGFAELMAGMLNLIGIDAASDQIFVYVGAETYRITQDCLGWKSAAAFTGLVAASPGSRRNKAFFLMLGIAALLVANVFRVITTIYLSHIELISFEIIHGTLWKWGLTVLVLGMWVYWFRAINGQANL